MIRISRCLLPNTIFGTPVRANKTPLGGAVVTFPDLRSKATASKAKVDEEIMRPVIAPDDILGLIKKWRPPPLLPTAALGNLWLDLSTVGEGWAPGKAVDVVLFL